MKFNKKTALVFVLSVLVALLIAFPLAGQDEGTDETKYTLEKVKLSGNENVKKETILEELGVKEGEEITRGSLEEKVANLSDSGYFKDVESNIKVENGKITPTLKVKEYPVLREFKFEGVNLVGKGKLRQGLKDAGVKKGEVINKKDLNKGLENIAKKYEKQGYPLINTGNISIAETLSIEIIEGKLVSNRVEGLSSIPEDVALGMIETTKGKPVKLRELQKSYQSLRNSVYFTSVELVPARGYEKSDIILRWKLTERVVLDQPVKASGIDLLGNTVFSNKELSKLIRRLPGGEVTNYDVLRALSPVYRKYNEQGYRFADFSFKEVSDGNLLIELQEGKITALTIKGNTKTATKVITNKLFLEEGDIYNQELMTDSRRRILNLGYFSKVEPSPKRTQEGIQLVITVGEKQRLNSINGGLTWSDGGLGGRIRLSTKNIFGMGQDVSLNLSRKFSLDAKFDGSIEWKNTLYPSGFNFTKLRLYRNVGSNQGVEASFGYPVSGNLSLNLGYNADWITSDESSGNSLTNILSADLIYDNRDNPNFPTDGSRRSLRIEKAGDFAPGLSFTQFTFRNTYFQGLPDLQIAGERTQVLGLNLQLGLGLDTPSNYQSEFIGKRSIRGLGTKRTASTYGFLNTEYRLQLLPRSLYVASFVDSGVDLANQGAYDFKTSAGFEINLQAFGQLRVGAAWPLSEDFGYVPNFYFGMGPVF
jgi:outer membrane protein assembly factor BamA